MDTSRDEDEKLRGLLTASRENRSQAKMVKREYPSAIPKSETSFPHFVFMKKQGRWITPKWQPVFYVKADWHSGWGWSKALSQLAGWQHTQSHGLPSSSGWLAELGQGQKFNLLVVRFTLLAVRNALTRLLLQAVTTCALQCLSSLSDSFLRTF